MFNSKSTCIQENEPFSSGQLQTHAHKGQPESQSTNEKNTKRYKKKIRKWSWQKGIDGGGKRLRENWEMKMARIYM